MNWTRQLTLVLVMLLALSAASAGFVGSAAASHEEETNPLDEILSSDDEEEENSYVTKAKGYVPDYLLTTMAGVDGQLQRAYAWTGAKWPFSEGPPTNKENALTFEDSLEIHGDTFVTLVNNETTPSADYNVHKVTFAEESSEPYTLYVVADIENESIQQVQTYKESEFDENETAPDVEWVVDNNAAEDLSELTDEMATHIRDKEPIDRGKQAQLVGRYCSVSSPFSDSGSLEGCDIRSSLWMEHDQLYEGVEDAE